MQVLQYLGSEPWQVGMARAVVSWPEDEKVFWKAEDAAHLAEPEVHKGYRYLTVRLPLDESKSMPDDAPSRYRRPTVLRVGTFSDWSELSRLMAPFFLTAAKVAPDSAVARQAAEIMKKTDDPLERAALATRLVQDKVSYLLNGLEGGNYLPQEAEFTWDKRYGDCKAKSVLLLSLLKQMGIEAEPTLIASSGGDALPYLLPLPGDFDHVIVHATIAGVDYWLDGTSAATRLNTIDSVPPFYFALPLREGGADLAPLTRRDKTYPDMVMSGTIDHSAGVDMPLLFSITMEGSGPQAAAVEAIADADDPDFLRKMAGSFANSGGMKGGVLSNITMSYDKEAALARVVIEGVASTDFEWKDGKLIVDAGNRTQDVMFNPNRARREWRDIPVATPGPSYSKFNFSLKLPDKGKGFQVTGQGPRKLQFANTKILADTQLVGDTIRTQMEMWQTLGEVAPADVAKAKRDALRIKADASEIVAPTEVTWLWDLDDAERRAKAAPILKAYDKAIAFARKDDFGPLYFKAEFLRNIFDFDGALAAYNELVEKNPIAWNHRMRASVLLALGCRENAVADLQEAYDLDPANETAFSLATEMAYVGRADEALELLDALPVSDDDRAGYADTRATVAGLGGDTDSGLSLLAAEVAEKPENSEALNSQCWFRGLFDVAVDDAVSGCTRAIERANNPAPALDSRAMVEYRLGKYDEAIADLDAVLKLAPAIANSRYMRGVVRLMKGDTGGKEDIRKALRINPQLGAYYARHGIEPAT